jgi:DNA-directed RNA polymerase subunit RPC12/RpoP
MVLASVGGVVTMVVIVLVLVGVAVAKIGTLRSTSCIHCGHDSGISGLRAAVCPACGRNRTVLNSRKARRR